LLKAGLMDERSLLHYPVVDGAATSPTLFKQDNEPGPPRQFELLSVEQRPASILWLRYQAKEE